MSNTKSIRLEEKHIEFLIRRHGSVISRAVKLAIEELMKQEEKNGKN